MIDNTVITPAMLALLETHHTPKQLENIQFPPPVFKTMQGELIEFDAQEKTLKNRFPVLEAYLNPYDTLQGGIIAAAIDNTIGPLSMLIASANFTRQLDVKYSKTIPANMTYFEVTARFTEQRKKQLFFEALVTNPEEERLVTAKAIHWIIDKYQ